MCKSVRGAAFFGSSLHLAFSFVFLLWFLFDTVISEININLWKCDSAELKFRDLDPLSHYLNLLFKLLYFSGLFVTGIYIFRGVERETPRLLKFAALAFIIIQVVGVILFSVFFSIQWNIDTNKDLDLKPEAARRIAAVVSSESRNSTHPIPQPSSNEVSQIESAISDDTLNIVTPMANENVLPAPPETETTTTTTPMPVPVPVETTTPVPTTTTTTVETTTLATTTTSPPPVAVLDPPESDCTTKDCTLSPSQPVKRLPHNQLVSLVFQMCTVVANGLGSVAYVIVLGLYMVKL